MTVFHIVSKIYTLFKKFSHPDLHLIGSVPDFSILNLLFLPFLLHLFTHKFQTNV